MGKFGFIFLLVCIAVAARAEELFPIEEGTTWEYEMREEFGGPAAALPATTSSALRVGRESHEGKDFVKLETIVDEAVIKTELAIADEKGLVCHFRAGKDGRLAKIDPPQVIVPPELKPGTSWDSDGEVAGTEIHQHFTVTGEEPILVAAGSFRGFHIHCEDSSVMSVKQDRWFVAGVGFVKETTVVRGPTGGLLQRVNLELQKKPEIIAKPVVEPTPSPPPASPTPTAPLRGPAIETDPAQSSKKLAVEVSTAPAGGSRPEFKSDAENIYVRWRGRGSPEGARIRVAWIAEDVGDLVEPNFIIDETESVAPTSDATARFTLGRPPDGWAEGKYRVEFYINDELEETVHVTIVK